MPLLGLKPSLQRLVSGELALVLGGGFGPGTDPAGGHSFLGGGGWLGVFGVVFWIGRGKGRGEIEFVFQNIGGRRMR